VGKYRLKNSRRLLLLLADGVALSFACFCSYFLIDYLAVEAIPTRALLQAILIFVGFNLTGMVLCNVYKNIWRYASIKDFLNCIWGLLIGTFGYYITIRLMHLHYPEIFSLSALLLSICAIVILRTGYSYIYTKLTRNEAEDKRAKRLLIIGAGDACRQILAEIKKNECNFTPVGLIDDDLQKSGRKILGVTVLGTTAEIPGIVKEKRVKNIFIAIPSADKNTQKRILGICSETGCEVKVLPYLHELITGGALLDQIKPIRVEDLLGREVIKFDNQDMKQLIQDRVCLVTGGGGSIGSELCRQIAKYKPKKLVIVDIYENNAYDIQQELKREYGNKLSLFVEIASVRDMKKVEDIFVEYQPALVFHAAAHKHVPLMETNPEEAVKNNVIGTYNVARQAAAHHADKFVLVSTDKAVNPTNVMGATKRCCEMIVQYMAQKTKGTDFVAVRFGNVLGSNGSVIPLFEKQIAEGGPVTVTDPEIIRYFMTIPEAVSLILQAAHMARGGEIFVLDMGEPVKIVSLAENLIRLHGKEPYEDIKIKFTGLRPGEKLFEELLMAEEGLRETANKKIFIGRQIEIDENSFLEKIQTIHTYAEQNDKVQVVRLLSELVPTFQHKQEENKDAESA